MWATVCQQLRFLIESTHAYFHGIQVCHDDPSTGDAMQNRRDNSIVLKQRLFSVFWIVGSKIDFNITDTDLIFTPLFYLLWYTFWETDTLYLV